MGLGNQENGRVKTTLDLPDDLVRAVKLRALQRGHKLKDAFADLLRQGLAAAAMEPAPRMRPKISTDPKTGLPLIKGLPGAPISKMSSEEIYALIHKSQEEEDIERLGISLRR
jgi:plasmid stability protein